MAKPKPLGIPQLDPLKIVYRNPTELTPHPNNARFHPRTQLAKLERFIAKVGFCSAVVIDEQLVILCGHLRVLAAIKLGLPSIPTIQLGAMSEADKRALILADNRIAEDAKYDKATLRRELQGLIELGYEVELSGFTTLEIDTLLNVGEEQPHDDDVRLPAEDTPVVSRVGDLWHIGPHRLLVGDACDPANYERLMAGELAQLCVTDPPYGCRIANNVSGLGRVQHGEFVQGSSGVLDASFSMGLLRPAIRNMVKHSAPGALAFMFIDWRGAPFLLDAAQGVVEEVKNLIVWSKTNASNGTTYRSAYELIYLFKLTDGKHINTFGLGEGGWYRTNVWVYPGANTFRAGRIKDLADHPTVKPKKLIADAILDTSRRGDIVLDVFAGSGTLLVSAEMTGRRGYAMELDPKFADVALARIMAESRLPAMLDGKIPWDDVAAMRSVDLKDQGTRS